MKKKNRIILGAAVLLAIAAVILGLRVRNEQIMREKAGAIVLKNGGKETVIPISDLDRTGFSGETVNGKGDRFNRTYRGIEVISLLERCGVSAGAVTGMKAVSADQYSAAFTGEEIREEGRVFLAVQIDGKTVEGIDPGKPGVQVIVFGDSDSKRAVRNLAFLELETD